MALPPAAQCLRDYQRRQLGHAAISIRDRISRLLLQLPTGGGKTHELAALALCAQLVGLRVLILATRTRLVRQAHERLEEFGVPHGIIAAQMRGMLDRFQLVQVASVDTLHRRCMVDSRMPLPSADVVIFDEAHMAVARSRMALLDQYPNAVRIGFTATPARKSGGSLAAGFDRLILGPSILDLIRAGQLVRPRIYNAPVVTQQELRALPKDAASDYAEGASATLFRRPKLLGDVVANWLRLVAGRRTIVFACNKAHGADLTREFCEAGIAAELLTDQDDETEREAVVSRLESGQTLVVINCFLMAYGIDIPAVEAIVLARPTRSLTMYLQMVGRGLRPAPGKSECVLIDHGRVVESLGLPHADRDWTLDQRRNVNAEAEQCQGSRSGVEKPRTCPECAHMWVVSEDGTGCRQCGWKPVPSARAVQVEDADLTELEEQDQKTAAVQQAALREFYAQALQHGIQHQAQVWAEKPGRVKATAWHRTADKFAVPHEPFPRWIWDERAKPCSSEVAGWIKSQQIRFAKRRRAA